MKTLINGKICGVEKSRLDEYLKKNDYDYGLSREKNDDSYEIIVKL